MLCMHNKEVIFGVKCRFWVKSCCVQFAVLSGQRAMIEMPFIPSRNEK